jgi:hypothetical protein
MIRHAIAAALVGIVYLFMYPGKYDVAEWWFWFLAGGFVGAFSFFAKLFSSPTEVIRLAQGGNHPVQAGVSVFFVGMLGWGTAFWLIWGVAIGL